MGSNIFKNEELSFKYPNNWKLLEADDIENAVNTVLNKGYRTADIMQEGKTLVGTKAMGEAILKEI